jgi:peptidoglycan/xylan/chitin deacetylase (PgdA/CDA1 family)
MSLKRLLLGLLEAPGIAGILAGLTGTRASIFMLHRFSDPEHGVSGHSPEVLRAILSHLRKQHYDLLPLQELFLRLKEGRPLKRAVAFTIDDGYFDHGRIGGPIFAEYDCPATIFAVSGFLDGKIWLWWDQIRYIFGQTRRTRITVRLNGQQTVYGLDSPESRGAAATAVSFLCQDALHTHRTACIADLSQEAGVEIPASAPAIFAPLTWDEARQLEKRGITFAPHTVTHPVLSSTSAEHVETEITESWNRLRAELAHPVPVFCYPHGRRRDYGDREMSAVDRAGLWGAVAGHAYPFRPGDFRNPPAICRVPRFAFQDSKLDVLQCVSGVATLKARFRRAG